MVDTLFASIPFTDTNRPLMAPAICKSVAIQAGLTSMALDLNIEFLDRILTHPRKEHLLSFFKDGFLHDDVAQDVFEILKEICDRILVHEPNLVGFSVFTYDCMWSARYISWMLKKMRPNIKIVLGGSGLFANLAAEQTPAEQLRQDGIIDAYIKGDGERELYNYLRHGTHGPGVNQPMIWRQMDNSEIRTLPVPDYRDYDFDLYDNHMLPILGSRGCVRNCTFCDVHAHWKKYTWRPGEDIFREMVTLGEQYGIYRFAFGDSLVNGNQKEYRNMVRLMADWNRSGKPRMGWRSFFIFRPVTSMTEEDWRLTAESGAENLLVGIESLAENVRRDLGKDFSNDDIEFSLRMARKYGVNLTFLFLIGYITETADDIDRAVKWWEDHAEYRDIVSVNLGSPLGILKNTPLAQQFEHLGLRWIGPNDQDWVNGNSDPATRVQWYERLSDTLRRVGFQEFKPFDNYFIMERIKHNDGLHKG